MSAQSTNFWLGGYWTAGNADGLIWHRGRWLDGQWYKGQWFSYTLDLKWEVSNEHRNEWSIWSGGTWRSNSQNHYTFDDYKITDEYSIWHGGRWKSLPYESSVYSWQGENATALDIYGDITTYVADATGTRTILLPSARSLFLGGQWLRGVWEGGIFSNSIWHSLPFSNIGYSYLDDLFYLYEHNEYPTFWNPAPDYSEIYGDNSILTFDSFGNTEETLDTQILYNEDEIFNIAYTDDEVYDETLSDFYSGAFVNSVWEGGRVLDTDEDPYVTMFGMSLSSNRKKVFDDGGIQNENGFYESNILLENRLYGLNLPDWEEYYSNSQDDEVVNQKMIRMYDTTTDEGDDTTGYFIPNDLSSVGFYSVIWKRGKFQHGTFNYGQFYDYSSTNEITTSYTSDADINNTFENYISVFNKGLMYKSLFYGGLVMAQFTDTETSKSVFSRCLWLTGYWAAASEVSLGPLPRSSFTDSRYVTNAHFWKSIWMNGIWEGGNMLLSAWNCVNPFTYDITINNETFEPSADETDIFSNINSNPLGKITEFDYYDENGDLYEIFQNVVDDFNKSELLNPQSADVSNLTDIDIAENDDNYFMFYYGVDEIDYADNYNASGNNFADYPPGTPYDFVLVNDVDSGAPESGVGYGCISGPTSELICPNDGNSPIMMFDYYGLVDLGLVLANDDERTTNTDIENENIFRTLGQVHNLLSVWQNGQFEGGIWNGGLWIKGNMQAYNFENYPDNIIDASENEAVFDYFDNNVINNTTQQQDPSLWTRGIWYGGYMHANTYFTSVPAYISGGVGSQSLTLDISTKSCLTDLIFSSYFNSVSTSLLQLKSLNLVSINCRKSIRFLYTSNYFFNVMNGQTMGGYFLDRLRTESNTTIVPLIGTVVPEFPNDVASDGESKLSFGNWVVDHTDSNETQIINSASTFLLKNTTDNNLIATLVAEPYLYDVDNSEYNSTVVTGVNAIGRSVTDKFYYEYLGTSDLPIDRLELKHAIANSAGYAQRVYSDLYTQCDSGDPSYPANCLGLDSSDVNLIVPSYAVGAADITSPEPFELP